MTPDNNIQPGSIPGQQSVNSTIVQDVNSRIMADEEEGINLRDFFVKCFTRWRWFVVSLVICLGLGAYYVLRTPKVYTRMASVMVKDEDGAAQDVTSALSDIGLFKTSTNVANEILAFQSPALVGDVIARLGLRTNYTYRKLLRPITLYGDSTVLVASFPDAKPNDGMFFKAKLVDGGKVEISDIQQDKEEYDETYTVALGDTVATPAGRIVLQPGRNFSPDFSHTINVTLMPMTTAISYYQKQLNISLADEDATVINFSMEDVCVEREVNFLNTLIEIYNEKWRLDKEQMAVATSRFITDRLGVIERELGNVDSDIADFKGENLVPDIEAASSMFMEDANENTKRQMEVSTQIAIVKHVIDYLRSPENAGALLPANAGIESQSIDKQVSEYNTLLLERNRLLAATGENGPMIKDLDARLSGIKSALMVALGNQQQALNTELNSLIRSDKATTKKIASSPSQAKYLLSVERQQKVKEALYLYLLQKREENELSMAFTPGNLRIITPPWGEIKPTSPVVRNIILIAFVAGLLLPAIVIFILESIDTRVNSRADLESLHAPFVGEIPESGKTNMALMRWRRRWRDITGKESAMEEAPKLLVHAHGRSVVNESFRMVRSNLEFVIRNAKNRVVMVTSFNPGSGKSFISYNLGAALAVKRKESRIIIIDLDLRRASLSRVVNNRARGIADYLSEAVDDVKPYIQPTECEGLSILPVGTIPPNPSELLYSERLQQLLDKLRAEYDYILLDCPPIEIVADTSIITPLADVTLFVMRAGLMDRRLLPDLNYMYDTRRFNNLLVLLNGTTAAGSPYRRYVYSNYYSKKE